MRTRHIAVAAVVAIACMPGCGSSSSSPSASTPVAAAPTPAPTPVPTPTPAPAAAVNVNGMWTSEARSWDFSLEQKGTALTGRVTGYKSERYPDDAVFDIVGTVSSSGKVDFKTPNLVFAIDFTGQVDSTGRKITGTLYDCVQTCRNYGEVLAKQ